MQFQACIIPLDVGCWTAVRAEIKCSSFVCRIEIQLPVQPFILFGILEWQETVFVVIKHDIHIGNINIYPTGEAEYW